MHFNIILTPDWETHVVFFHSLALWTKLAVTFWFLITDTDSVKGDSGHTRPVKGI